MIQLAPFLPIDEPIRLFADVRFFERAIEFEFELHDPKSNLKKPIQDGHRGLSQLKRTQDLWKTTCFEIFWSRPGSKDYWEFNLSTAFEWNLYHFDSYRTPQLPLESSDFAIREIHQNSQRITGVLGCSKQYETLEFNLSAVLDINQPQVIYCSAAHGSDQKAGSGNRNSLGQQSLRPDFHLRENMKIRRSSI